MLGITLLLICVMSILPTLLVASSELGGGTKRRELVEFELDSEGYCASSGDSVGQELGVGGGVDTATACGLWRGSPASSIPVLDGIGEESCHSFLGCRANTLILNRYASSTSSDLAIFSAITGSREQPAAHFPWFLS